MNKLGVLAAVASLTLVGRAIAQPAPSVQVAYGPAVQARFEQLGQPDLDDERNSLAHAVQRAIAHGNQAGRIQSVSLVIQDIQNNRPTAAQMGAVADLSFASHGVGGAAITGQVVEADGTVRPVRYREFETDLRDETNFDVWGDAEQAFTNLADAIGRGRAPYQTNGWPPPVGVSAPTGTRIAPTG